MRGCKKSEVVCSGQRSACISQTGAYQSNMMLACQDTQPFWAQRLIHLFYQHPKMHRFSVKPALNHGTDCVLCVWPSFCSRLHQDIFGIIPLEPGRLLWINAKGSKRWLTIFDGEYIYITSNYTATLLCQVDHSRSLSHFERAQDTHQGS